MTSYPYWATPPNLGTFVEGYSFTLHPIVLNFGDSSNNPLVTLTPSLLNGSLPEGITWYKKGNTLVLEGYLRQVTSTQTYQFTFRISNGTYVADRTFTMVLENVAVAEFYFVTDNSQPLIYYYESGPASNIVRAESVPTSAITYSLLDQLDPPQGISIDSQTGEITVDLTWKALTNYQTVLGASDYVINAGKLYKCAISGISGSQGGPSTLGIGIIDCDYPAWQPGRFYALNSLVYNDTGKIYVCTQYGYSSNSGPTGTGTGIVDGTCVWNYLNQALVWDEITPNTSVLINRTVQAQTGLQTITNTYSISLLSRPYKPVWITPAGALPDAPVNGNWSYQLEAFDPDGLAVGWSSNNLPSWLNLNNVGFLYGNAPSVSSTVSYNFSVDVSDDVYTVSQAFTITIRNSTQNFLWITDSDLGTARDGEFSSLGVLAQSLRANATVSYGVSGGMLPLGLILDNQSGLLQGFLEYHGQDKIYQFEITATDGVDSLVRQFSVLVQAQNRGHHWSLHVPLLGSDKQQFIVNNGENVVTYEQLYQPLQTGWGRTTSPGIPIIDGIRGINALDLRMLIANYTHNFNIRLQNYTMQESQTGDFKQLALQCRDADSLPLWQPSTKYAQGSRVSTQRGYRYVATNSGTSGSSAPSALGVSVTDGSMIWSWEGVPNTTSQAYVLPWYNYRQYNQNDVIENDGYRYQALTSGYSGGGSGPELSQLNNLLQVSDGDVTWQYVGTTYTDARGTFWPSNVYNIRKMLTQQVGWSNAWGTGAQVSANVSFDGQISSAQVVSAGTGYNCPPTCTILGSGSGAKLKFTVGVVAVNIEPDSTGWIVGDMIKVDLGNGTPANLQVTAVDTFSHVTDIQILRAGSFERIPVRPMMFGDSSKLITLTLVAGIVSVSVENPGSGYDPSNTSINLQGQEYAGVLGTTTEFELVMPVAYLLDSVSSDIASSAYNPFQGQIVEAHLLEADLEGIMWNGYTRFDQETVCFDGDATRFVDIEPSTETTFEEANTYWDNRILSWDRTPVIWPQWSTTVFDQNHTVFDYYKTLFDGASPRTESFYSRKWLWWFGKPYENAR